MQYSFLSFAVGRLTPQYAKTLAILAIKLSYQQHGRESRKYMLRFRVAGNAAKHPPHLLAWCFHPLISKSEVHAQMKAKRFRRLTG